MSELSEELINRFTYHASTEEQTQKYEGIRKMGLVFASMITDLCPESRERSTALTKIDETVMHANASIARHS
jgi:hypothetical protein